MTKQISKGDLLVNKDSIQIEHDPVYEAVEDAPPYPVETVAKTLHQDRIEIPEEAIDDYIVGNSKTVFEQACEVTGFSHSDPRCDAGIIISKKEVAIALADLGGEVSKEVVKNLILGNPPEESAADILITLSEAYIDRNENSDKWFDNVRISDLDTAYCKECGEIITDGLKR